MKLWSKKEADHKVEDLIAEQRQKEEARIWRRGWCIQQATFISDESTSAELIRKARDIYAYVYGEEDLA
jgi:hypothetical protein